MKKVLGKHLAGFGFMAGLFFLCFVGSLFAGQPAVATANVTVPPLVNFSGVLSDLNGKSLTGTVGVTFSLYKDSEGGAPLWVETQNVQADKTGHYSVMLGSTTTQGLPFELFTPGLTARAIWATRPARIAGKCSLRVESPRGSGMKPACSYASLTIPYAASY